MAELLRDAAGRRRLPATLPEFHTDRPPRNKGMRYPADPPTIEEIIAVTRRAGGGVHGRRVRGLIVVLWRADLRSREALALAEADLDPRRGRRQRRGGDRPASTDLELHAQRHIWLILQSCCSLTTCSLASHDEFRASTPTIDLRSPLLGQRQRPMPTVAVGA